MWKYYEQYAEKTNPVWDDIAIIADSEELNAQWRRDSKKIKISNIKTSTLNNDAKFAKKTESVWVFADVEIANPANQDALIFNSVTWKFENVNLPWGWNMLKSVYDPQLIEWDAFDRENHTWVAPVKSIWEWWGFPLVNVLSTSLISWWDVSINAWDNTKFDVAAWKWVVIDNHTNPANPVVNYINFWPFTAISPTFLTNNAVSYISIDKNWAIVQNSSLPVRKNIRDAFVLWSANHPNQTNISAANNFAVAPYLNTALNLDDWMEAVWSLMNPDWNVYTYNWANLKLNKSAWRIFWVWANYKTNKKDPNNISTMALTELSFVDSWRDWIWWFNIWSIKTDVIPWIYDDWTWWATAPSWTYWPSQYVNHKIYYDASTNLTAIQYWQNVYWNIDTAIANLTSENFEKNPIFKWLMFRWWITLRWNAVDLSIPAEATFSAGWVFNEIWSANLTTIAASLQSAYENSTDPEITTNATLWAFSVKQWSWNDADCIIEWKNWAWVQTFCVSWDWKIKWDWSEITNLPVAESFPKAIWTHYAWDIPSSRSYYTHNLWLSLIDFDLWKYQVRVYGKYWTNWYEILPWGAILRTLWGTSTGSQKSYLSENDVNVYPYSNSYTNGIVQIMQMY